ncbi:MAG: sulfurtransferase-like selenium metabolism protein YedF [Spirochaetota bacterium]
MDLVIINSDSMGQGDAALGAQLTGSFLRTLCSAGTRPNAIVFYNAGVKLLAEGSPVLDALDILARAGIDLAACGTCVSFYKIADLKAGRVSTMKEIVGMMGNARSAVTI